MNQLTEGEEKQLIDLLEKLNPGHLSTDLFYSIARLVVTPTFVTVPIVCSENKVKVYLKKRSADDRSYPNMLHSVGKVILSSDETLNETYSRLLHSELGEVTIKRGPVFVNVVFENIVRGKEVSLIHWVELEETLDANCLYDASDLPKETIPTDIKRIEMAVNHFVSDSRTGNNPK